VTEALGRVGGHSEVAPILSLLLKHPRDAWRSPAAIRAQWRALRYSGEPDFERGVAEYERFIELLAADGADLHFLPPDDRTGLDSVYARDAALVTDGGLILCRMGKAPREDEPAAVGDFCRAAGFSVLGAIEAPGTVEGGDVLWLDGRTLAVGRGYRTNAEGIRQLRDLLGRPAVEVVEIPLPHGNGPEDVLHLMSLISPVDVSTLLVSSRFLPVPGRETLLDRGFRLLEVPAEEYDTMGGNVLAVAPGRCVALAGNPGTRRALEAAGIQVREYEGLEISLRGAGGPTCLTRPLRRA
jgi:arginine deiminase